MTPFAEWATAPEGFFDVPAKEIRRFSADPILLHLAGRRAQPLFISILLHGNEDTGWRALQMVMQRFAGHELPRALSIFIGNVPAAALEVRRLDHQPDFNRVWPGTEATQTPEAEMMYEISRRMQQKSPFAFIDIHNNTGINPHYSCLTSLTPQNLYLARLFSRIVVYFQRPLGTAAAAMAEICPSITVECGKAGTAAGDEHAAELISAALHLEAIPKTSHIHLDTDIYRTVATIKVADDATLGFGESQADVVFPAHFEEWNFSELAGGTAFAATSAKAVNQLIAIGDTGENVTTEFFAKEGSSFRLRRSVMPAMITSNEKVIRQDCLCYLMEKYAGSVGSS